MTKGEAWAELCKQTILLAEAAVRWEEACTAYKEASKQEGKTNE